MRELISFDLPALELTDVALVDDVRLLTTSVSLVFVTRSNSFMLNLFLTHTIANAATGRNLKHAKLRIDDDKEHAIAALMQCALMACDAPEHCAAHRERFKEIA